jgi:hypothetical protein
VVDVVWLTDVLVCWVVGVGFGTGFGVTIEVVVVEDVDVNAGREGDVFAGAGSRARWRGCSGVVTTACFDSRELAAATALLAACAREAAATYVER